jgi:hypothetical protein
MSNMNGKNGKTPEPVLRNHVAVVLDESGSMMAMYREVIEGFNEQVAAIRESAEDQPTTVSLVKFNTHVPDPVYWVRPVEAMRPLTEADYNPNGMTAMLDAVGLTVDRLRALPDADDENTAFLVLILSDGQENNSRKYSHKDIAERIQELDRTDRWTFAYMGANQNLATVAQDMAIPFENTSSFDATSQGVAEGSLLMAESTRAYMGKRRAGQKSDKAFYRAPDPAPEPEPEKDGEFWGGSLPVKWR